MADEIDSHQGYPHGNLRSGSYAYEPESHHEVLPQDARLGGEPVRFDIRTLKHDYKRQYSTEQNPNDTTTTPTKRTDFSDDASHGRVADNDFEGPTIFFKWDPAARHFRQVSYSVHKKERYQELPDFHLSGLWRHCLVTPSSCSDERRWFATEGWKYDPHIDLYVAPPSTWPTDASPWMTPFKKCLPIDTRPERIHGKVPQSIHCVEEAYRPAGGPSHQSSFDGPGSDVPNQKDLDSIYEMQLETTYRRVPMKTNEKATQYYKLQWGPADDPCSYSVIDELLRQTFKMAPSSFELELQTKVKLFDKIIRSWRTLQSWTMDPNTNWRSQIAFGHQKPLMDALENFQAHHNDDHYENLEQVMVKCHVALPTCDDLALHLCSVMVNVRFSDRNIITPLNLLEQLNPILNINKSCVYQMTDRTGVAFDAAQPGFLMTDKSNILAEVILYIGHPEMDKHSKSRIVQLLDMERPVPENYLPPMKGDLLETYGIKYTEPNPEDKHFLPNMSQIPEFDAMVRNRW